MDVEVGVVNVTTPTCGLTQALFISDVTFGWLKSFTWTQLFISVDLAGPSP